MPPPSSTVLVPGLVVGGGHQTVVTADCPPVKFLITSSDQLTDSSQTTHPDPPQLGLADCYCQLGLFVSDSTRDGRVPGDTRPASINLTQSGKDILEILFFLVKPFIFEENMKGKVGSFFPPETNILYENIISFKLLTRHGIYSGINSYS